MELVKPHPTNFYNPRNPATVQRYVDTTRLSTPTSEPSSQPASQHNTGHSYSTTTRHRTT
ncbi:hypothetical protein E2C01_100570 [Portunus trituberculatus]|uniref:Uncharacterized protein n=1 Tax=Portunus trituberculatus TaxID=210409 RepID=A0A5B7KIA4_PORTR|nr:hypothetical protein [Portunus trituberculatus]